MISDERNHDVFSVSMKHKLTTFRLIYVDMFWNNLTRVVMKAIRVDECTGKHVRVGCWTIRNIDDQLYCWTVVLIVNQEKDSRVIGCPTPYCHSFGHHIHPYYSNQTIVLA